MSSEKKNAWFFQWSTFSSDADFVSFDSFLFNEWIYPAALEDFSGKTVLDCGCGRGQHLKFLLPYIRNGMGIDYNTAAIAQEYIGSDKVKVIRGDLATVALDETFDIVYSIGVLHHTQDPTRSFNNIKRFVRPGGRMIVWVYAHEGNLLNRLFLEPLNRYIFSKLGRKPLLAISVVLTALLYVPVYTLYLLPLPFLPFYKYFANFRKLSFKRNFLNVFDKVNAPITHFIKEATVREWFNMNDFADIHVSHYAGVSWRASGTVRKK